MCAIPLSAQELKEEIAVMRGDKIYRSGALSVDEKARCAALVQAFVTGPVRKEDEDLGMPPSTKIVLLVSRMHSTGWGLTLRWVSVWLFHRVSGG